MYDHPDDVRNLRQPLYYSKRTVELEKRIAKRFGMQRGAMRHRILVAFYARLDAVPVGQERLAIESHFTQLQMG